jgi:Flp pilus assembly pilin Flp
MTSFFAHLEATLYVFGQNLADRKEKGQTTAEYVGIVAFVALLAVLVIGFKDEISELARGILTGAFGKISEALG